MDGIDGDGEQLDMLGRINKRTGSMRRLRHMRKQAGFAEVHFWVPEDQVEHIKDYARDLIEKSGKHLPDFKNPRY